MKKAGVALFFVFLYMFMLIVFSGVAHAKDLNSPALTVGFSGFFEEETLVCSFYRTNDAGNVPTELLVDGEILTDEEMAGVEGRAFLVGSDSEIVSENARIILWDEAYNTGPGATNTVNVSTGYGNTAMNSLNALSIVGR